MTCERDMMKKQHQEVEELLRALEAEMRRIGLWSSVPPSPQDMSSVMPFMYDTLHLHEWLQWVFVPRTRALMEAGRALPENCNIHPLAEHEMEKLEEVKTEILLEIILQIDSAMNQEK